MLANARFLESGNMPIVFGLGSGRCGTKSFAELVNGQPSSCCFHEANPSSMAWSGAEGTVGSLLRDFEAILNGEERHVALDRVVPNRVEPMARLLSLSQVKTIGDVANYYLNYVGFILEHRPDAKFVCMQRDRVGTIDSFVRKLHGSKSSSFRAFLKKNRARNHWLPSPSQQWTRDKIWDKCFPKFDLSADAPLADYVAAYYDFYYDWSRLLQNAHPLNFRIFDLGGLNCTNGRLEILEFCMPDSEHVDVEVHANKG
jgi:hypothetical protein